MKKYIELDNADIKKILAEKFGVDPEAVQSELATLPKKYPSEKPKYEPLYKVYDGEVINNEEK